MQIKAIKKIHLDIPKKFYDVVNAFPYNNFLIKTNSKYICSHNCFFDEISFIRNQDIDKQKKKAKDMIDTAIGGMMTRFVHNGKNPTVLCVSSSKRSSQSFMEQYIKSLEEHEGNKTLIVDKAVWEVKPHGTYSDETFKIGLGNKYLENILIPKEDYNHLEIYKEKGYQIINAPIDFLGKAQEDLERMLCDYAGVSSESSNKYISATAVKNIINKNIHNPFPDIIEVGNGPDDHYQYANFFKLENIPSEYMEKPLFIHLDMSISGDMTGIAGVWIAGKKPSTDGSDQARDLIFRLAFSTSIKAPKGRQISFEKNRNFIRWLRDKGFKIRGITTDTFQAYDLQQQMKNEGFNCSLLSVDRVGPDHICHPYQYLKSAVYENRVIIYPSDRLFDEFVQIERNLATGKVDHPVNGHKDCLDSVCGAIFNASQYADEYAYNYGDSITYEIDANDGMTDEQRKKQMIVSFEEELTKIYEETNATALKERERRKKEYEDIMDMDDGIFAL